MTLGSLAVWLLLITCIWLFWQHLNISHSAYKAARQRTEDVGVVLLDQSVILRKIALQRSAHSLFALQRRYDFEFSSIGDVRYPGYVVFAGKRLQEIHLAAFRTPEQFEPLEQN